MWDIEYSVIMSEVIKSFDCTTFWLDSWLKSTSFGSNFFCLAKVLATTNSEPG